MIKLISILLVVTQSAFAQSNPKVDMDGHLVVSQEAAEYRKDRLVSERQFIRIITL